MSARGSIFSLRTSTHSLIKSAAELKKGAKDIKKIHFPLFGFAAIQSLPKVFIIGVCFPSSQVSPQFGQE